MNDNKEMGIRCEWRTSVETSSNMNWTHETKIGSLLGSFKMWEQSFFDENLVDKPSFSDKMGGYYEVLRIFEFGYARLTELTKLHRLKI